MKRLALCCILVAVLLAGCKTEDPTPMASALAVPDAAATLTPSPKSAPTVAAVMTAEPTASPTLAPTPEPTPVIVSIGAAGDVALTSVHVASEYDRETNTYLLDDMFTGMIPLIESVDLMCVNLETPVAGEKAGYSGRGTTENVDLLGNGKYPFNAPDALLTAMKNAGIDVATTANNHFYDRGEEGIVSTLDALDAAGLLHTGTFRSPEERAKPLVVDVNGVKLGIVAVTDVLNSTANARQSDLTYLISRLTYRELLVRELQSCREAGAEFIIVFIHWDREYEAAPRKYTVEYAKWLLEQGADCIVGSHPHVIQRFEYLTVERADGPYTGLVAYSMGNFLFRMFGQNRNYGLFLRLRVQRDVDGRTSLLDAAYLPTFCISSRDAKTDREHVEVLPAYADESKIHPSARADVSELKLAAYSRKHALDVCGTDVVPLLDARMPDAGEPEQDLTGEDREEP